jgi:hypothetical protein
MELGLYEQLHVRGADMNTATVKGGIAPMRPIDVIRYGAVITTALTAAGTLILKKRTTAGDSGTDSVLATFTFDAAERARGLVVFFDLATAQRINPGEEVVLEVGVVGGAASVADLFIDYQPRGFHKKDTSSAYYADLKDQNP